MKFVMVLVAFLLNMSCVTVGENLVPQHEYAAAKQWGGSVSVIYKFEGVRGVDTTEFRHSHSSDVDTFTPVLENLFKEHFDEVHVANGNFTQWPVHRDADFKIDLSMSTHSDFGGWQMINMFPFVYSLGIIPYTTKYKEVVRLRAYKGDRLLGSSEKTDRFRLWVTSLFVFFSEGDQAVLPYLKNQIRAALNELVEKEKTASALP